MAGRRILFRERRSLRHELDGRRTTGARVRGSIARDWEAGLRPLQAIHHQAGNHLVEIDGDRATAFCYGIAFHYLPNPTGQNSRTFVGSYDFELEKREGRWRITAFRFNLKYREGNLELESSH